ncbi:hypothetical protein, conserved [Leishmania tarentolae]|uniref:non-specific serine/threonine protein kinase n=1 Tax=Leishmania tarentolae TaxID=5689 RepID=A0A640KG97_LEITA|nr:hypothetical protein, conserved [Leishmania tarentolae]
MNDLPHWPRYRPIRVIGQGGFGTVYLCVDTEPTSAIYEQEVAVKAVSLGALSDEEVLLAMSEVSLLKNINHPNIITYYDSFLYDEDESAQSQKRGTALVPQAESDDMAAAGAGLRSQWLCLVTEYMDGGDLASLLRQYNGQGLNNSKGSCEGTSLKTVDTVVAARKRDRSLPTVKDDASALADQGDASEEDWVGRSRRHRQRLATTLRAAARPPMSTSETAVTMTTGMQWGGIDASVDQTWLSDASSAAMPTTPLGATDFEAAGVATRSSRNDVGIPTMAASNTTAGSAGTGAPPLTSVSSETMAAAAGRLAFELIEPQLPPLPNQLWVESFLITDIAKQCLDALAYLHALCIVHRDIKPSNIYLSKRDGTVKIGDFGVSKLLQPAAPFTTTFVGTPFYLCPELCMGDSYSFGADIWALGVVLYELYCLKLPFTSDNVLGQIYVITEGTYDTAALRTPHRFSEPQRAVLEKLYGPSFLHSEHLLHTLVVSMIDKMLHVDPAERPSAEELLTGVFGAGNTSRCGSSAGLVLASVAPTPLHRASSTCAIAHCTASTTLQRAFSSSAAVPVGVAVATSQAPHNRLGPSASGQHAQWAGSLVVAASCTLQQQQGAIPPPLTASGSRCSRERRDDVANDFTEARAPLAVRVKTSVGDILRGMPSVQRERLGSRSAAEEKGVKGMLSQALPPVALLKSAPSPVPSHSTVEAGVRSNSDHRQAVPALSFAESWLAETSTLHEKHSGSVVGTDPLPLELDGNTALQLLPAAPFPLELLYDGLASIVDSSVNATGATGEQRTVEDKALMKSPLGAQAVQHASPLSCISSADAPPVGRTRFDDEDALDHPIGAQTHSEIMALMENIPWLKNAEVFSAIPLSASCDNVMLVERANHSSVSLSDDDSAMGSVAGSTAVGGSQERVEITAPVPKDSRAASPQGQLRLSATPSLSSPLRQPHSPATDTEGMRMSSKSLLPICRAGVVSPTAPRMEVKTISGTTITMGGSRRSLTSRSPCQRGATRAAEIAEAEGILSTSQRRISDGFTSASGKLPCTPAVSLRQHVPLGALPTTARTSTSTLPASQRDKLHFAQVASGSVCQSPSRPPSGDADRQPTVATVVNKDTSASRPWLLSFSSGVAPTVGNTASEARLRPFSAAQMCATAMTSASVAAPPTPKACFPGHCEGYSTTELESLLQAKLLAHYQRRRRQLGAQRAQYAAQEAAKAEARAKLKALYDEVFVSRLGAASSDAADIAACHSSGTIGGTSQLRDEFVAHADERSRAIGDSVDSGAHTSSGDVLVVPPAPAAMQLPARETEGWAADAPVAVCSPREATSPTPPSAPFSCNSLLPFPVDTTARQAEEEESVLRVLAAVYPRPLDIPAMTAPSTGTLIGGSDDSKDWLARTLTARRVREAASMAVAVEHQRAAFRHGKEPTRLRVAPPWRPPYDSRDVPGLWETSSAEEEADASMRGQLGCPAPENVRYEVRWRWSVPPSDLGDTAGTTSEDEERGVLSSRTTSSSSLPSTSTPLSPSSASLASTSQANTPGVPGQAPMTSSMTETLEADVQQRAPSWKLLCSEKELGDGAIDSWGCPDDVHAEARHPSLMLGWPTHSKSDTVDGDMRGAREPEDGTHGAPWSRSSLADTSEKETAETDEENDERDWDSASSSPTTFSTSSAWSSSASHSSRLLSHLHHGKGGELNDVSGSSHDDDSSAENSISTSADFSSSALPTASSSFHNFSGAASSTDAYSDDAEHSVATKKTESDEDEDMSYTYAVQLDAVTGRRHFEYICPVTVEVVGALPGGYRIVSAAAALHALDSTKGASFSATPMPTNERCNMQQGSEELATRGLAGEAPMRCEGSDKTSAPNGGISSCLGQDERSLLDGACHAMWQENGGFGTPLASLPPPSAPPPSTLLPLDAGATRGFTGAPGRQQGHVPETDGTSPPEGFQSARAATSCSAPPPITNRPRDATARVTTASSSGGKSGSIHDNGATESLRRSAASQQVSAAPVAKVAAPLRPFHTVLAAHSEETTAKAHTVLTRPSADSHLTTLNTEVLPAPKRSLTSADGNPVMAFLCDRLFTQGHTAMAPAKGIAAAVDTRWRVRVPSSPSASSQGLETSHHEHPLVGPPTYLRLPVSLALRPLRPRTRFVGLLWRLWLSLKASEVALSRVLLHRRGGGPSPSPGCTFAEAFGDWVTGTASALNTDACEGAQEYVAQHSSSAASTSLHLRDTIATDAMTETFTNSDTATDSQVLQAPAPLTAPLCSSLWKWGLYYVEARTMCAVQLRTDEDWAVVRRKVVEMGTMLPFVRLYLLLEEAESASE